MNKVILTGRFTRDPEIKYTNDGRAVSTGYRTSMLVRKWL